MSRRLGVLALLLAYVVSTFAGCASAPTTPTPPTPPAPPTSAVAGSTTVVAVAPPAQPCCPHPTLWEFLGIKALGQGVGGLLTRLRNRLGMRFPGLEAKPPLLAITDPANMGPDAPPAVKAAAEAKAYEDQAAQKIKAIRYLATLGCTECFPDIEKALLEALNDCTEAVRYEAVLAIRELAGGPCATCKANSCCSPAITRKLQQLANETDSRGCFVEPSARVRRVARLALNACGGAVSTGDLPTEGPDAPLPPAEGASPDAPPPPAPPAGAGAPAAEVTRLPTHSQPVSQPRMQPTPARSYCPRCKTVHAAHEPHRDEQIMAASFGEPVAPPGGDAGMVLAEVNGEPIFERDVVAEMRHRGEDSLRAALQRQIDRKLLCQAARRAGFTGRPEGAQPASHEPPSDDELAARWLQQAVRIDESVSRQEVFAFYRSQLPRFQPPAEVRWESLTAPLDRYGSQQAAEAAIAYLRNRAQGLAVAPPENVDLGRVVPQTHSWTRREGIASPDLGHWLFSLPVGTLSPILYDDRSVYVVRVLERRQGRAVSLEQATPAIEREIVAARRDAAERHYVDSLRRDASIWTALDAATMPTRRL